MAGLAVVGELGLELLHLGAQRVGTGPEQARERLGQFFFDVAVLLVERDEAHDIPSPQRAWCLQNLPLQVSLRNDLPFDERRTGRSPCARIVQANERTSS